MRLGSEGAEQSKIRPRSEGAQHIQPPTPTSPPCRAPHGLARPSPPTWGPAWRCCAACSGPGEPADHQPRAPSSCLCRALDLAVRVPAPACRICCAGPPPLPVFPAGLSRGLLLPCVRRLFASGCVSCTCCSAPPAPQVGGGGGAGTGGAAPAPAGVPAEGPAVLALHPGKPAPWPALAWGDLPALSRRHLQLALPAPGSSPPGVAAMPAWRELVFPNQPPEPLVPLVSARSCQLPPQTSAPPPRPPPP